MSESMDTGPGLAPPPINEYGRIDAGSYLRFLMHAYSIALLIVQVVAMPGELLLRRRFGERYLDPLMVLLGFVGLFMLGATVMAQEEGSISSVLIFAFLYLFLAVIHRIAILHRDLKGETWHSQNAGLPWPILTLPSRLIANFIGRLPPAPFGQGYRERLQLVVAEYVQLFVEPILVSMAGGAMIRQSLTLGNVLPLIAAAMLLKNVLDYHVQRANMLDIIDASIEAEHRIDALTGAKGPEEAKGYKVSGVRLPASSRKMFGGSVPANDDRQKGAPPYESAQA